LQSGSLKSHCYCRKGIAVTQDFVILTGATGLLGVEFSKKLFELGYNLILTGRDEKKLENLKKEMPSSTAKNKIITICLDHSLKDSAKLLIENITQHGVSVGYIINNVRDVDNLKTSYPILEDHLWMHEFYLGVVFPYRLIMSLNASSSHAIKSVVNISSMYGSVVPNAALYDDFDIDKPIHYGVVKAALNQLTKELAVRLAGHNAIVNAIAYGGVVGRTSQNFMEQYSKLCPKSRMLNHKDIFSILKFLLFDASDMMTGQIIAVDGGWTLW